MRFITTFGLLAVHCLMGWFFGFFWGVWIGVAAVAGLYLAIGLWLMLAADHRHPARVALAWWPGMLFMRAFTWVVGE